MHNRELKKHGLGYPRRTVTWHTSDGKRFADYDAAEAHQHTIDSKPMFDKFEKDIKEALRKWT